MGVEIGKTFRGGLRSNDCFADEEYMASFVDYELRLFALRSVTGDRWLGGCELGWDGRGCGAPWEVYYCTPNPPKHPKHPNNSKHHTRNITHPRYSSTSPHYTTRHIAQQYFSTPALHDSAVYLVSSREPNRLPTARGAEGDTKHTRAS